MMRENLINQLRIEDFRNWEKNPMTQLLKLELQEMREALKEKLIHGATLDHHDIGAATAEVVGTIRGIDLFLNIDADQIKEILEEGATDEVTSQGSGT